MYSKQDRPLLINFRNNAEVFHNVVAWMYFTDHHMRVTPKESNSSSSSTGDSSPTSPSGNEWDLSYAGLVRYVFSTLVRRSSNFIRRGLRLRPRAFAHSTDRLKELVEFREHYLSAHESGHEGEHSSTKKGGSRLHRIAKEILPGFLKHVGFATLVFSSYETLYDDHYLEFQRELHTSNTNLRTVSTLGPLLCGGLAGTLGGLFYITWDAIAHQWRQVGTVKGATNFVPHYYHPISRTKIVIAHGITQSVLFGSYEMMKKFFVSTHLHAKVSIFCHYYLPTWISLEHGDSSHTTSDLTFSAFERHFPYPSSFLADIICISICGGIAGVMCENLKHWLKVYDLLYHSRETTSHEIIRKREEVYDLLRKSKSQSIGTRWKTFIHVLFPRTHHLINAAIPMSLAFVAYEYGKELTAKEHHHHSS